MSALSDKAKQICKQHHAKSCSGCPIKQACYARTGAGQEAVDRWREGVNAAAERVGS